MIDTAIGLVLDPTERFFAYARERHAIYMRRFAAPHTAAYAAVPDYNGLTYQWTDDPILGQYSFTNIFRELDAVTIWCREHVRTVRPEWLLPALVLFRWFNRIDSGEVLFSQPELFDGRTAFEQFMAGDGLPMRSRLPLLRQALRRKGPPYVTGSYTINTRGAGKNLDKLDGVLALFGKFMQASFGLPTAGSGAIPFDWNELTEVLQTNEGWVHEPGAVLGLRDTWEWLRQHRNLGDFMAYEVVCDLRWTPLLKSAPDVLTWANPGPGAVRGLKRLRGLANPTNSAVPDAEAQREMQTLLALSTENDCWPTSWPRWEMREVEHTLCEFDKYERTRLGQGRPRRKFHG